MGFALLMGASTQSVLALECSLAPGQIDLSIDNTRVFELSVTNLGPEEVTTIKFDTAGDTGYFQFAEGGGSSIEYTDDLPSVGGSSTYSPSIVGLAQTPENAPSIVALMSSDGGSNYTLCSGGRAVSVAVSVSNVNLAIGNSSATLSFSTGQAATATVVYGATSNYGNTVTSGLGTSHSVTLTGLSASTLYHYQIRVAGEGGTEKALSDASFTTTAANSTTTVTTTVTETVNQVVKQTVIIADTVKPTVLVNTKLLESYASAPMIIGRVSDTGSVNVGIAKIQYSVDGGKNWMLVDEPSGASKVNFEFVPEIFEDGSYMVQIRALDKSGNIGISQTQELVIDRLPPRIIHSLWRVGPMLLSQPYQVAPDTDINVSIQAIGGVTQLSLSVENHTFEFVKNIENGLWEGVLRLKGGDIADGLHSVQVYAKDAGLNEIRQQLGQVEFFAQNSSKSDFLPSMSIYRFDELSKKYLLWNSEIYGQANPSKGKPWWYLPPGKYYVQSKQKGYQSGVSNIFEMAVAGLVEIKGQLEPVSMWNFFTTKKLSIEHKLEKTQTMSSGTLGWIEKLPEKGVVMDIAVVPIWEPRLAQILQMMTSDSLVVLPGSSPSGVSTLKARGGYALKMVADPDGEILQDLKELDLPVVLRVDRRGQYIQQTMK
jgi:hypothetical protein